MGEGKKLFFLESKILFLSGLFLTLAKTFQMIDFSKVSGFLQAIAAGIEIYRKNILQAEFFSRFPMVFIVLTWILIGTIIYFVYLSFSSIYHTLFNILLLKAVEKRFINCENPTDAKRFHRYLLHSILISLLLVISFLFITLSMVIALKLPQMLYPVIRKDEILTGITLFTIFIYLNIAYYLFHIIYDKFVEHSLEEEHMPIELEKI